MKKLHVSRFFLWIIVFSASQVIAQSAITITDGSFFDQSRKRDIPYRIYSPAELRGSYPVVIFSHGLGGSREGYSYIGQHLAENGFIAVHIQHAGSDKAVWEGAKTQKSIGRKLALSLLKPKNAVNRFKDLPFVLNELERLKKAGERIFSNMDLNRIGMAGHSYGGRSTMIAAGERLGKLYLNYKDDRITCGVVLSPNQPKEGVTISKAYANIDIPLFHITGTKDASPLPSEKDMNPIVRTNPYKWLDITGQYLLVLNGADHMTFSGHRLGTPEETEADPGHLEIVKSGVTAFFRGYLCGDAESMHYLKDIFPKTLSAGDHYEWK